MAVAVKARRGGRGRPASTTEPEEIHGMDVPSALAVREPSPLESAFVAANRWLVILLMGLMAALVFANVVSRYVLNHSIIWVEELTQYQMIWITYLGAGLALREGRHVAVNVVEAMLPPRLRRAVRCAIGVAMLAFLVTVVVLGFQIAAFTWSQETPVMNLPTGVPYLGVPIGALVCALHLVLVFRDFVDGRFEHADEPGGHAE